MFTASELFDLAVRVEENGERFYRDALGSVKRDALRNLLGWLADQELQHMSAFLEIKERIGDKTKPAPSLSSLSRQALRSAMGRHVFSLDELQIGSIRDEEEILRAAIEFEEDAILFFEFIGSFVSDPGALSILEQLRAEELKHKLLLTEKMSEISKKTL
ncbi:MAG: ferritin family protein [Syntrophobacteraceae bacterium]